MTNPHWKRSQADRWEKRLAIRWQQARWTRVFVLWLLPLLFLFLWLAQRSQNPPRPALTPQDWGLAALAVLISLGLTFRERLWLILTRGDWGPTWAAYHTELKQLKQQEHDLRLKEQELKDRERAVQIRRSKIDQQR
jgi:hypothetical protein